jgi:hypothetical protein
MLLSSGIVPSGSSDTEDISQLFDAIAATLSPPGTIVAGAYNDTPANLGLRLILLDGTSVLFASYPDLDANVYVGDANNTNVFNAGGMFYRSSDAAGTTPNIAGPYLQLPDMRGEFIRGLDLTGTKDVDGGGRILGDKQNTAIRRHMHYVWNFGSLLYPFPLSGRDFSAGARNVIDFVAGGAATNSTIGATTIETTATIDGIPGVPSGVQSNQENRPPNTAFDLFIRY